MEDLYILDEEILNILPQKNNREIKIYKNKLNR